MKTCLLIGIGGAVGAILRYLLGMLPLSGDFPLATFLTNLLGAIAIGLVIGVSERFPQLPRELVLFLKTGFCGGFTTFSTFSLETLTLLEGGQAVLGSLYAVLSVLSCVFGVFLGRLLAVSLSPTI